MMHSDFGEFDLDMDYLDDYYDYSGNSSDDYNHSLYEDDIDEDIGISTELTFALENKEYAKAIDLINANAENPDYFNQGLTGRKPLHIVLSGYTDYNIEEKLPIHLQLAKLLLEHGADPNHKELNDVYMEKTEFHPPMYLAHPQYTQENYTAMQLLLQLYIINHWLHTRDDWASKHPEMIDTKGVPFADFDAFKFQMLELIQLFLSKNGIQSLQTGYPYNHPIFHRILKYAPDKELIDVLLNAGVKTKLLDNYRNNCVHALVNYDENLAQDTGNRIHILQQILQTDDVRENIETTIDAPNRFHQTCLWICIVRHNVDLAKILIEAGASTTHYPGTTRNILDTQFDFFRSNFLLLNTSYYDHYGYEIPLILAPLISPSLHSETSTYSQLKKHLNEGLNVVSRIVDLGLLDVAKTKEDIVKFSADFSILNEHTNILMETKDTVIVNHLFGRSTSSLRQLCIRSIFENVSKNLNKVEKLVSKTNRKNKTRKRKKNSKKEKNKRRNKRKQTKTSPDQDFCIQCKYAEILARDDHDAAASYRKKRSCTHINLDKCDSEKIEFILDILKLPRFFLKYFVLEVFRAKICLFFPGFLHVNVDLDLKHTDTSLDFDNQYDLSDYDFSDDGTISDNSYLDSDYEDDLEDYYNLWVH